jgi:hypothetical protein
MNDAVELREFGKQRDPRWGGNNNIATGVTESGRRIAASTNGSYGSPYARLEMEREMRRRGYEVVKNAPGLSNGTWHAEGRLIQYGINTGDRVVAMGVSDKMCAACQADAKRFGIRTNNGSYTPQEYDRFPQTRPHDPSGKCP